MYIEKKNTYLEEEWICGAAKIDVGGKSPFVLRKNSNDFQNYEPCLYGSFSRIINSLIPRSTRQFQGNDNRHRSIVIRQSLFGLDPWRPREMNDLQQKRDISFWPSDP